MDDLIKLNINLFNLLEELREELRGSLEFRFQLRQKQGNNGETLENGYLMPGNSDIYPYIGKDKKTNKKLFFNYNNNRTLINSKAYPNDNSLKTNLLYFFKNEIVYDNDGIESVRTQIGNKKFNNIDIEEISNDHFWAEIKSLKAQPKNEDTEDNKGEGVVKNSLPLNLILFGPPGTGKTHCTVDKALERLLPKHELDSLNAITSKDDKRKAQEEKFNELKKQGRIVFTTFHQSMSYEDFIEGIKPETDDDGNVTYEVKPGIFKQLCEKAKLSQTSSNFNEAYNTFINDLTSAGYYGNNPSKFVTSNKSTFGISVNSKGNLSLFTGNPLKKQGTITKDNLELRFLGNSNYNYWESYFKRIIEHLEDRYQLQQENRPNNNNYVLIIDEINRGNVANIFGELITLIEDDKRGKLSVELPYSKDFSVPKNLYIIGTMNTADRSVEALDTALRRRFSFEEMMPKYDLAELEKEVCDHKLSDILRTINSRIEVLKDRDHLIGHSYLMKVNDENDLKSVFFDKIIPLLQEYFYGDYEKILMVLGDGFVKEETPKVAFAGNGNYDSMPDKVYHIADNNKIDMNAAIMSMKIQEWEKSKAEVILENPEDTNTNLSNDSEQG